MLYTLPYFQRPYNDSNYLSTINKTINNINYIVYRPNHGLAHSLRQGFLVRDIVTLLKHNTWLNNEIKTDKYFVIKLAILSSFQRSGRQSEISSSQNPVLYAKYEESDVKNMIHAMSSIKNSYFSSYQEINLWATALKWDSNNKCNKIINISKLIKAAHLLDLRRIPQFDEHIIRREVAELLKIKTDSIIMNKIWEQSGKYLYASGDRDLSIGKNLWSDDFFILHQNPVKLYFELRKYMLH